MPGSPGPELGCKLDHVPKLTPDIDILSAIACELEFH